MATVDVSSSQLSLLSLPPEILEKILSFLRYEEISNARLVCTAFDTICQQLLNQGFSNAEKLHVVIYREIKAKLPRRESERRNHSLARHMDILAALETRLSLLAMTYIKYMEMGMCCFIPGKVLDEIYQILYRISSDPNPPRPHELLTELRDISSMAMEHFDEKIVPVLRTQVKNGEPELNQGTTEPVKCLPDQQLQIPYFQMSEHTGRPVINSRVVPLRVELMQLRNSMRSTSSTVVCLRKEVNDYKSVIADQHKKMLEQDKKIVYLNCLVSEMKKKIADQEKMLCDLRNSVLSLELHLEKTGTKSGILCNGSNSDDGDDVSCDKNSDGSPCEECMASSSHVLYAGGGIPSPDSIDPDSANLKTLLDVLDTEPLLLPVKTTTKKRQRPDDISNSVSSSYHMDDHPPVKKSR